MTASGSGPQTTTTTHLTSSYSWRRWHCGASSAPRVLREELREIGFKSSFKKQLKSVRMNKTMGKLSSFEQVSRFSVICTVKERVG